MASLTKTTPVPDSRCPQCGYRMEAATSFAGRTPEPGNTSICIDCGAALVFTEAMGLRQMTDAEFLDLDDETRRMVQKIRMGLRILKAKRN